MSRIRFVHSLSTRPLLVNCYGIDGLKRLLTQAAYFALSVAYLKREGQYVVLHTDSLGRAVLGHLPYDEVHLTLDEMPRDINPRFWAASKFVALSHEQAPCVHIDGDVFIKNAEVVNMIDELMAEADVVFQGRDKAEMYAMERPLFEREEEFCNAHHCYPDGRDAYNTGLMGFSSENVLHDIVGNYLEVVKHFSATYGTELDKNTFLTPDLIAEQKMIEGYVRDNALRCKLLLEQPEDAAKIGYQHVYTIDKHNDLPRCLETLRIISPEIFENTARLLGLQ